MSKTLDQIAEELRNSNKKVQLIYAFNGTGKTRLSRKFKHLISPKDYDSEEEYQSKVLYYNAFTEDLFYWDNDLEGDSVRKLMIRPNGFTNMALTFLKDQGLDNNIVTHFQHYTSDSITPFFKDDFSEVTFAFASGGDDSNNNIKISKGEESNFIWSVFYSLLEQIVEILNIPETNERPTNQFDGLEYIFIDDPVSSLDDTNLIELAVNMATSIKRSYYNRIDATGLKFIITTHNPLFFNILFNEFNNAEPSSGYKRKDSVRNRLEKFEDGTYSLMRQEDDSPFSYHLFLLKELERVIELGEIKKYHFTFLRNILEKTSTFLGYSKWIDLLPNETEGARENYYNRIINLSSHSNHHGEEIAEITESEKNVLNYLVNQIKTNFQFNNN